jgi:hypothetical protein
MLLALPIAAVANVLLRYAHERYTHSQLYAGGQPTILLDPQRTPVEGLHPPQDPPSP